MSVNGPVQSVTEPASPDMLGGWRRQFASLLRGEDDRSRTQRNVVLAFLVRVFSAAILYLSQIVLARWMGAAEYGIYVFVWAWVLLLGGLSNLGMSTLMIRLLPAYREQDEMAALRGLLRMGRLMALAFSTCVAITAGAALWWLGDQITSAYVLPLFLALACVPIITLSDVQDGIGRANGWMSIALVPPYILRPLLVLLAMTAAHLSGFALSATTAAGAAVAATWLAAVVQTVLVQRRLRETVTAGPREYTPRAWLANSLPLLAITGAELALQNTDVLVVSRYLAPADVGIYFAAAKTMSLIMFVHYAVGSAVANRFSALGARGDAEQLSAFVKDAVNWTFWPSLAIAVAILAVGKPLLWLFGPQFVEGYPMMVILSLGFLARAAVGPAEFLLNMLGAQRACALALAFTAALNLLLNLLLVPRMGLLGAATATATSLVVLAVLNAVVAYQHLGIRVGIWSHLPRR